MPQGLSLIALPVDDHGEALGYQAGGRVFLFLEVDEEARDYQSDVDRDVRFTEPPRYEPYEGQVPVLR